MIILNQRETMVRGRHVLIDNGIGHLMVAHEFATPFYDEDSLENRHLAAWAEAEKVFA